jgi:hypothetical protein
MLTPRASLEALTALFMAGGTLADTTGKSATVTFMSRSVEHWGMGEDKVLATFIMKVPGAYWRSTELTSTAVSLTTASQAVDVLTGISAPVGDAIVRVKGAVTGLQVTDTSGAWMTFPSIPANQWLRFHAASGRAWVTTTDVWTGGTEQSGSVDFGGPRNRFELTPRRVTASDPTVRNARLTVTTGARTGASIQVRAKPAYAV